VERVGSTAFHRAKRLGRLTNYLTFMILVFLRAMFMRPKPDIVIAMTDPPVVSLAAAMVAVMRRARFVYNIRDLHPDMAIAAGIRVPRIAVGLWERLHRWALRRAVLVVVLGEDMRDRVVAKGIARDRTAVVRDGAWPLRPVRNGADIARQIRGDFNLVLVHAGNLGYAGDWDMLLEAAKFLAPDGVGLVFIGDGTRKRGLATKAAGVGNVRFLSFFPSEKLPEVLAAADIHIVAVRPGLEGLVVPSKLYPILMAGKPVFVVAPEASDAARIVRQNDCGVVINPSDVEGLVAAVRRLARDREALVTLGQHALRVSEEFSRERELSRFVGYIEGLAQPRLASSQVKG
jgi:glycosyltransferase involved in cell wall biosynthesis